MLTNKKINELHNSIQKNKSQIAILEEKLSYIKKVVSDGNGTPSLTFRVTEIEICIRTLDEDIQDLEELLRETSKSVLASSLSLIPAFIALALSFFQLHSSIGCEDASLNTLYLPQISNEVIRAGWVTF